MCPVLKFYSFFTTTKLFYRLKKKPKEGTSLSKRKFHCQNNPKTIIFLNQLAKLRNLGIIGKGQKMRLQAPFLPESPCILRRNVFNLFYLNYATLVVHYVKALCGFGLVEDETALRSLSQVFGRKVVS